MRTFAAIAFSFLVATPLAAQQTAAPEPGEQLVDRVVAVVGDTTVLLSELQADVARMRAEGETIPADDAGLAQLLRTVLERHVNELLLVEGARAAGITLTDNDVSQAVDRQMAQVRQSFPSEAAFTQALAQSGRTLEEYRAQLTDQLRTQGLVQRFEAQRFARMQRPRVTDDEARELFESQRAQLGQRPANISFQQAIITPEASDTAKAAARKQAEDVLAQIRAGGDFEVLARRFSADPGSKERGGDLGWFRQGQMVRPFEATAYALRPGMVSDVVETDYGYHIIRMDKVRGPERSAHHILFAPAIHPADIERARVRADSVAAAVRAGASLTELAAKVKTQADQVVAQRQELDKLPAEYTLAFQGIPAGQVVGPFQIEPAGRPAFVVARVTARQEAGQVEFADVAELARTRLVERRQEAMLVAELRNEVPVSLLL
ncbi:MAG TPA: peptidylprolyl isomerase [Longimicrobiaceae bacterium]|nr:peptidylprolyl isomerase [Longimicrobiaceae bacterium]